MRTEIRDFRHSMARDIKNGNGRTSNNGSARSGTAVGWRGRGHATFFSRAQGYVVRPTSRKAIGGIGMTQITTMCLRVSGCIAYAHSVHVHTRMLTRVSPHPIQRGHTMSASRRTY